MLSNLNDRQREAVTETEGQMLILAGAGSGKTRVLTTKIAWLIREKKVPADRILAITFTNKAAREMKERIAAELPELDIDRLWIGTFHSICARILRRRIDRIGYNRSFTIYDRDDQKSVLKEILKEQNTSEDALGVKLNSVISSISSHKNRRISPQELEATEPRYGFMRAVAMLYPLYEQKLKKNSALDFDDLILKALELFEKDRDTLDEYRERFLYVFVDEYQDTNRMQYDLVKTLSEKHKNLCVVGDIDQSIYKFRGADIKNILDFEKDFPNASLVKLEQNYRSTQNILDLANRVIDHNIERKEKVLWTDNGAGEPVRYHLCSTSDEEAQRVVRWIHYRQGEGIPLKEMAILYRTNAQSRSFEDQLRREGIPYRLVGGLKFYDRKEIKDIAAYLKIIVNPLDNVSLLRVINTPKRGIGKTTTDRLAEWGFRTGKSFMEAIRDGEQIPGIGRATGEKLDGFVRLVDELTALAQTLGLTEFVKEVVRKTGYEKMLKATGLPEDRTRLENIDEYISSVAEYEENNEGATLWQYLQDVSLLSDTDKAEGEENGVSLMTVHSAKGTEYDVVFVTGLEQGLFPSLRAIDEGELEEERRLCYVALTRARQELFLSGAQSRRQYGNFQYAKPSCFIEEMGDGIQMEQSTPYDAPLVQEEVRKDPHAERFAQRFRQPVAQKDDGEKFSTGDRVLHGVWGEGMVVMTQDLEAQDQMLTLSFPNVGLKKVKKSFAKLRRL